MTVDELIDLLTSMKVHGLITGDFRVRVIDGEIVGVMETVYTENVCLISEKSNFDRV